jgi:Putative zinc-finger
MDMDHLDAKRLQAAEKYVLGELPPELRDEYEEHYFDCADCAEDIKAASAFVGASRDIFRDEPAPVVRVPAVKPAPGGFSGWFAWLRPAIAVPVMVSLVAIITFQAVTERSAKDRLSSTETQAFQSSFRVQGSTRGAGEIAKISMGPREAFGLDFDFTPSSMSSSYEGRILDESGKSLLTISLPGNLANKEVHLAIPGGLLSPGQYTLVVAKNDTSTKSEGSKEVQRFRFAIEFHE